MHLVKVNPTDERINICNMQQLTVNLLDANITLDIVKRDHLMAFFQFLH